MNSLYTRLQWLPPPPADLPARLKDLDAAGDGFGAAAQALASCALDVNQLAKLARRIGNEQARGTTLAPLTPFRLAILSNATVDFLAPAIVASAARHGIALEVVQPPFDQVAQQAVNPNSETHRARPDAVLFAIDYRALPLKLDLGDADAAQATIEKTIEYLQTLRDGVREHSHAVCIFQTFAPPPETLFGSLDRVLAGTLRSLLDAVNRELAAMLTGSGDVLFDVAGLAETVGLAAWHDPQLWNLAKLAFCAELIPLYADHVARTIAALRGKSRKALVLDLDNILWGGVIGDDGLEGIKLAQGDAQGEAYLAVQRFALQLRDRGIVLAVSSKNTDEVARQPFLKHPEMLLKLEHITVFQANWNDKATNIRAIAEELSLGLDSMVFLDDNPAERGLVRKLLPQVAVPELPEEPALYARTLAAAGYFEATAFASEDKQRAEFYAGNARRAELKTQASGVDAYLESLDMTITFQPFDATSRARIAQLINKSNQYNLTACRYTEPEVADAEEQPNVFTLQVRLADIFGDNGMISVVICRTAGPRIWEFDTWLMSCRVLGRRVENMVLREVMRHARLAGVTTLQGVYRPNEKNKIVADHYAKLGFQKFEEEESGVTWWRLPVDGPEPEAAPMKVVSSGFRTTDATVTA
jgi:FkbH-like protein